MIVGITGGIGAGKSYVSAIFAERGFTVIDADEVCRGIYHGECLGEVLDTFGEGVLTEDGNLDRKALGAIVFNDRAELDTLNGIAHRYIDAEIKAMIKSAETPNVLIDAPQLFEAGVDKECDAVIYVYAPKEERIARVMARDGLSRSDVENRMKMQHDDEFFRSRCAFIINNGDGEDVAKQVNEIIKRIGGYNNGN
jgi:dephospho-CoA kinase